MIIPRISQSVMKNYQYMIDIEAMNICEIDDNLIGLLQIYPKPYIELSVVFSKNDIVSLQELLLQAEIGIPLFWIAGMKDANSVLHNFHHYVMKTEYKGMAQILAIPQATNPLMCKVCQKTEYNLSLQKLNDALSYSCKAAHIGHWTMDLRTFVLSLSKEKCSMLGIETTEMQGEYYDIDVQTYAQKYVLEEDIPSIQKNTQIAVENINNLQFTNSFEYRYIHPLTGELRVVAVRGSMVKNGVLHGVSQDITELNQTKREKERLATYRNLIFQNSKDGIMLFNSSGMIDCNEASLEMFRIKDKSTIIGKKISDYSPEFQPNGENSVKLLETIAHTIQEQKHIFFEWQHKRFDNTLFFVEVSVIVVDLFGEELELVTLRDVSERKQIIADLTTQIQNAEQFTYIVSHNLRSPIARILGLVESLNDNDSKEWQDFVIKNLQKDAQQLNQLTIDLNTILNLKKEKGNYNEEVFIPDVLVDSIDMLKDMIAEQEAKILVEIECEQPVIGVKEYIKSVFHNLISNAIKYRHPQRLPEIHIKVVSVEDKCVIWVEDNGIGIDLEKHKDKVFGLYKRFHPHIQGRGVGLHITKTQIEMMGGKIFIESKIDVGTRFKIVLNKA